MHRRNKRCLVCRPNHDTLYFHSTKENDEIWLYCNKCGRRYSIYEYLKESNASPEEISAQLNGATFIEAKPFEVNRLSFPRHFIPLYAPDAKPGVDYLARRGLEPVEGLYYDSYENGIVFPFYYESYFCGAQIRFIENKKTQDGKEWKITTMAGTRLGNLVFGWDQTPFPPLVKYVVVTEGAFNALSLQKAFSLYGPLYKNPWRFIAFSGSGLTHHHADVLRGLKNEGKKVIISSDNDAAGMKMFLKASEQEVLTHVSIPPVENEDWNDILVKHGERALLDAFKSRLKRFPYSSDEYK